MARRFIALATLIACTACGCSAPSDGAPLDGGDDGAPLDAGCDGFIFIDFPCRNRSVCVTATATMTCRTVGCLEATGSDACCSGLTCLQGEVTECPAGTVCFVQGDAGLGPGLMARCLPPRDAGVDADYAEWVEPGGGMYCW
jgi:hypothetical protein